MLIQKLRGLSSDQFVRNLGWLGAAELTNRVFRLLTTVTLARVFTPYDYGMVSVIYTVFDIAGSLSLTSGIRAKIVQADEEDVEQICNTSYWLFWIICGSLFIVQCLAAYPIARFYQNNQLILPICVVGLIFLTYPTFLVQAALIERENRLKVIAWCAASQAIVANIILVVLALLGLKVWAVVWSMVLSFPVWIIIANLNQPWRVSKSFNLASWQELISFSGKILGAELLFKFRLNVDYLIVGRFLGLEALGLYFFAFNAGLGISQSILNSLSAAWYPNYCQVRGDLQQLHKRFVNSFKTIAAVVVPVVLLQTSLAHFYVPIVFGAKWSGAVPILVLICLSAIPLAMSMSTSQLLRSVDKTNLDFGWNLFFTGFFVVSLLLAVPHGIFWVAATVLITQVIAVPAFTFWVNRLVFSAKTL
ncbi:lipopolysaccharide biosynthesis protein [Kovacikia minuta CCNUW1]|uniref:lipopolysaccharide biosynthesis protein n=1 Tax=Kovacikia minuta TaxID=2931930 RepID=UPI001CCE367F|nr:lipopolysaccharide biosynthesis protein [Kovacikia minuta]UBF27328.1 lipopolysaccharide biosynthesis protein [Kovacikia minuta CCNUW1]